MDSDTADVLQRLRHRLTRIAEHEAEIEAERSHFDAEVTALTQQPGWTVRGIARELGFRSDNAVRRALTRAQARSAPAASPAHVAQARPTRDQQDH